MSKSPHIYNLSFSCCYYKTVPLLQNLDKSQCFTNCNLMQLSKSNKSENFTSKRFFDFNLLEGKEKQLSTLGNYYTENSR